jgi:hypothetical protein
MLAITALLGVGVLAMAAAATQTPVAHESDAQPSYRPTVETEPAPQLRPSYVAPVARKPASSYTAPIARPAAPLAQPAPIDRPAAQLAQPAPIDQPSAPLTQSAQPATDALTVPPADTSAQPATDTVSTPPEDAPAQPATDALVTPPADSSTQPATDAIDTPPADASAQPATDAVSTPPDEAPAQPAKDALVTPPEDAPAQPATDAVSTPPADAPAQPVSINTYFETLLESADSSSDALPSKSKVTTIDPGFFSFIMRLQVIAKGNKRFTTLDKMTLENYDRGQVAHMLPRQATGTCYMYAALHAIMNHQALFSSTLQLLKHNITRSKYSAKASESEADATNRRWKELNSKMPEEKPVEWMTEDPTAVNETIVAATKADPELYDWIRQMNLYATMIAATQLTAEQRRDRRNKNTDLLFAMMTKKQNDLAKASVQKKEVLAKDSVDKMIHDVEGGSPATALENVMRSVGAEIKLYGKDKKVPKVTSFAFPNGVVALCIKNGGLSFPSDKTYLRADRVGIIGVFMKKREKFFGFGGHAVCYVRHVTDGVDTVYIADSNFTWLMTFEQWMREIKETYESRSLFFFTWSIIVGHVVDNKMTGGDPGVPVEQDEPEGKAIVDAAVLESILDDMSGGIKLDPVMAANLQKARAALSDLGDQV